MESTLGNAKGIQLGGTNRGSGFKQKSNREPTYFFPPNLTIRFSCHFHILFIPTIPMVLFDSYL